MLAGAKVGLASSGLGVGGRIDAEVADGEHGAVVGDAVTSEEFPGPLKSVHDRQHQHHLAPDRCAASIALNAEPPLVNTSSTIATRIPARSPPSTLFWVPWFLASSRTQNPSIGRPCAA